MGSSVALEGEKLLSKKKKKKKEIPRNKWFSLWTAVTSADPQ